ncbi:MAG: MmoB/DmpM family protein [Candidatus Dormibacteraeota bacterium]|nr:MmoB/DmpM family protein [Candidatus Dormibacteraeota bacterium]
MTTTLEPTNGGKGATKGLRHTVGISLMGSEETDAALEWIREAYPDASIKDRNCYYKIERDDSLEFDMAKIGERLGRDLTTEMFLVSMSTFYGRMVRSNDKIQIFAAEILPAERGA